jgi:peptide/nickel transport system permease protein
MRSLPGNIVDVLAVERGYTEDEKAYLREELGIDLPTPQYYALWLGNLLRGDLGRSLKTKQPIVDEMKRRLPVTLELGVIGLLLSICVAVPVGTIAAVKRNTVFDYVARSLAVFALAMPGFWLATLVIVWASVWFHWAPPLNYTPPWENPTKNFLQILIPAALFGLVLAGSQTRLLRATLLEVLREDYVRTARAKGLPAAAVLRRHTLRASLIPFVTIIGIQVPIVLGGAVVFEQIFSLPGMGTYLLDGLQNRDYTVVQAVNVVIAFIVVLANLTVDLIYVVLDPRIRYR